MTPIESAMGKVSWDHGCWEWTGRRDRSGYGRLSVPGESRSREMLAHRFIYEQLIGPIPRGLVLDHLCRTPWCVNPTHLEPVSMRENVDRGRTRAQSHCPHGHPYDEANTIVRKDKRICRTCKRDWSAKYKRKMRGEAAL